MRETDACFLFDQGAAPVECGFLLENPVNILETHDPLRLEGVLQALQEAIENGLHAAGFISYEAGYALEPCLRPFMPSRRRLPLIWFALFPSCETIRGERYKAWIKQRCAGKKAGQLTGIEPALGFADYRQRFDRIKQLIAAGDLYQANLAFKLSFHHQGDPFSLFARLRRNQPVSTGAFLQTDSFSLLSLSPELFFEAKNGILTTRPMKGTIRRGQTHKEDQALYQSLLEDEKNRAENLMIVDLMRNDFSRICTPGSVQVRDLYRVEPYATLFQMTSGVEGKLPLNLSFKELFKALFPAGSITGAPKIRAMEVIAALEDEPRGAYCGAMGLLSRHQRNGHLSALFNVAIRTLSLFPDGTGETYVGSGIVQDSQGREEYEECLLKGKFLSLPDFQLIETMRLDPGKGIYLRQRHMERLQNSCQELDFFCPLEEIEKALDRLETTHAKGTKPRMVRLLLSPAGGAFELSDRPVAAPDPDKTIGFIISEKRVNSANPLLAHKTTKRELFNEEWARAHEHYGADEVLFLNERGECSEGARSNLFVKRKGQLLTPPLSSGLLPGTLRAELLASGQATEKRLYPEDLADAPIFFGNSVRGLQPARLIKA